MKLLLFTPAAEASAIGRMASQVSRALIAHGNEITVIRTEDEPHLGDVIHDFGTTPVPWNDFDKIKKLAQKADAFIYQIGDFYGFHRGGLEWLPRLSGIVCLHDFFLGSLFYGWSLTRHKEADVVLRTWYEDDIADQFFRFTDGESFIEGTRDTAPLTEWVCSMAEGVVTHSSWGIQRVLNSCPGPVQVVPLAYDELAIPPSEAGSPPTGKVGLQILTIGHVNPNKRVASVIKAIGNSKVLRKHATYQLVGLIQPTVAEELSALAKQLGVKLVISGQVDDVTLAGAIEQADVISCLRWPSLEAASASAIEAMLYGKPTIVTNTGFYSEIPDSCVRKIDPENEIADMQAALEQLYKDVTFRFRLGLKAQKWAKETFTADNYARKLIEVVSSTMKAKVSLNAVNHFVGLMNKWGAGGDLSGIECIKEPLSLFNSGTVDKY